MSGFGVLQGFLHLLQFALPADEPRQATAGRHLQPRAQRPGAQDFIHGERRVYSFDLCRAQRFQLKIAFD